MVRIIVFDDVLFYCLGMKIAFNQFPDIHVAGKACNEESVFDLLAQTPVEVVILGVNSPDIAGCIGIAQRLQHNYPAIKIIAVVDEDNAMAIQSLFEMGVDGCIGKREANGHVLASMIRNAATKDEKNQLFNCSIMSMLIKETHKTYGLLLAVALVLCMLSVLQPLNAQQLRNQSNALIGTIESGGVIRDQSNYQIGRIESDGVIRNSSNVQIGKLQSDGVVRDKNNAQIGRIQSDGVVRDKNNVQTGRIESDGTVRNKNNVQIGSAKGVKQEWAAIAFFFFFDL